MQKHTFPLSDKIPSSKEIFFNPSQNEKYFIIECDTSFDIALTLILKNNAGQIDIRPFYNYELGKKFKKKPYHKFLILEKDKNLLPKELNITIRLF